MQPKAPRRQPASGDGENQRRLNIEEISRLQLARRLHDGPMQGVAALALRAHLAKRKLASDPGAAGEEVQQLEELARRTAQDLRYLQFSLIPQSLEAAGLDVALQDLLRQLDDLYDHKVQLILDAPAAKALSKSQQHLLFHIAAEALDNTRKHARASRVQLKLTQPEPQILLLEVEDDGIGFDTQVYEQPGEQDGKYGLAILRERVKLLHGELDIHSTLGSGTLLRVAAPVTASR